MKGIVEREGREKRARVRVKYWIWKQKDETMVMMETNDCRGI